MERNMYGARQSDGQIISILDVPPEMCGLKCDCICPACNTPFEACSLKENQKPRRYFRHYTKNPGCDAVKANESALHKMAKQIIEEERSIVIPKKEIPLRDFMKGFPAGLKSKLPPNYCVHKAMKLLCEDVITEKRVMDFQPDIIVVSQGNKYFVEIWATHKKSEEDIKKFQNYGLSPVLEIDLSTYMVKPISKAQLRTLLCAKTGLREWVYYPNEEELLEKARLFLEGKKVVKEYRKDQLKINAIFEEENYFIHLIDLEKNCARGYTKEVFSDFSFVKKLTNKLRFFLNIPITGEIIFECDRKVWQSLIFERWVYSNVGKHFNILKIFEELEEMLPTNLLLTKEELSVPHLFEHEYLPDRVICTYLNYLKSMGFIEIRGNLGIVLKSMSLDPPNLEYAHALKEAINQIGNKSSSPNVDKLIELELEGFWTAKKEKEAALRRARAQQINAATAARLKERIDSFDFTRNDIPPCYDDAGYMVVECVSCHTRSRVEPRPSRVEGYLYLVTSCRNCRNKK